MTTTMWMAKEKTLRDIRYRQQGSRHDTVGGGGGGGGVCRLRIIMVEIGRRFTHPTEPRNNLDLIAGTEGREGRARYSAFCSWMRSSKRGNYDRGGRHADYYSRCARCRRVLKSHAAFLSQGLTTGRRCDHIIYGWKGMRSEGMVIRTSTRAIRDLGMLKSHAVQLGIGGGVSCLTGLPRCTRHCALRDNAS